MRRLTTILPLIVVITMMTAAAPASARSQIAIGVANPNGADPSILQAHIEAVGRKPSLWALWSDWGSRGGQSACEVGTGSCAFPLETVKELHRRGIDAVVWWQPTDPQNWRLGEYERYKRIVAGHHDEYIRQWARDAKEAALISGRPIVVRFAHEATGRWFPWSIGHFDNTKYNYKRAWRHIHEVFKSVGARKHIRLVWSELRPKKWAYPGDAYVDYVGFTTLNWGVQGSWRSMKTIVNNQVRNALAFTKKPIFLVEVASHYKGGDKAKWIRRGYLHAYERHPKIKAIMYLDTDEPHLAVNQPDWRLARPGDGSALAAYRAIAKKYKFKGRVK